MNKPISLTAPGSMLKLTLVSSLMAILAGCASSPSPQQKADLAIQQANNTTADAQQQVAIAQQTTAINAAQANVVAQQQQAQINSLRMQLMAIGAQKTDHGTVVTLSDELFHTGQADMLVSSTDNMIKLADFFKHHPQFKATIDGYTDNVGTDSNNLALAQRRSNSVEAALINMGVPAGCLTTRAFGSANPIASNDTATGRQMNRRVEIVFALKGADAPM
jgi:outer membrane protein OmpA-like peptidoglycan-associated protein